MNISSSILILIVGLIIVGLFLFIFRGISGEDDWIKDSKGIWIKHGNPSETPNEVLEQQQAINCALNLYNQKKFIMNFSSQCLGDCGNYAVDVVHNPRNSEDDKPENTCLDYPLKVFKFIELDKDGNIVKVV